jgi:hypothetical protein
VQHCCNQDHIQGLVCTVQTTELRGRVSLLVPCHSHNEG